ncbi:MICOS complex subunit MIC27 [Pteropus alecto]|uniref:MICOS complex subunit n=3 Tax=Pteropus TaxID=9401 RepID=A0A6P3QFG4_PTEVA|nr:MICOS complex subunit MIC27 [Pteropus alecto]XP_011359451.1 MICOS complex subunit MIC27 isoform X1 [Pteropus vampyrus]ELK10215.1 Apolipoprotein O-like protein [Pteropus alecto]
MAAIRMGKLTTMPASLMCASISVHAAKEEESKKQLVKPEQLPMYTAPPLQSKYIEEQPGNLQMGFASIRTTTGRYIGWCKGVYIFVKNGIMDTVQFGKDAYVYLKNPPRDFLPKIGVITVSGLAGLVSARKGSRLKKIAYPLGLATLGAAVCYPVQSVIIAKVTGKKAYATSQQIYETVKSLWTKNNKKESLPEPKEKTKLGSSAEIEIPAKTTYNLKHSVALPTELNSETKSKSDSTSDASLFVPDLKLKDHGQSHPEDVDMYSTRS